MVVLLDAGPLGLVTNPRMSPESVQCTRWLQSLLARDIEVLVPEIADYEVRRELLRAGKLAGLQRLNVLKAEIGYLPISTSVTLTAADFWAQARRHGRPTAPPHALDCDMILAAQAAHLRTKGTEAMIATTNMRHLEMFADARHWRDME